MGDTLDQTETAVGPDAIWSAACVFARAEVMNLDGGVGLSDTDDEVEWRVDLADADRDEFTGDEGDVANDGVGEVAVGADPPDVVAGQARGSATGP